MDLCRYVLACLALLTASAGPLPLVAHRLTCHHIQAERGENQYDACHHGCDCTQQKPGANWAQGIVSAEEDECSTCFQLSQLSQPTPENLAAILKERSPELVVELQSITTIEAISPNAPRGPPVA